MILTIKYKQKQNYFYYLLIFLFFYYSYIIFDTSGASALCESSEMGSSPMKPVLWSLRIQWNQFEPVSTVLWSLLTSIVATLILMQQVWTSIPGVVFYQNPVKPVLCSHLFQIVSPSQWMWSSCCTEFWKIWSWRILKHSSVSWICGQIRSPFASWRQQTEWELWTWWSNSTMLRERSRSLRRSWGRWTSITWLISSWGTDWSESQRLDLKTCQNFLKCTFLIQTIEEGQI